MTESTRFPGCSVFQTTNNGKTVWKATRSLGFSDGKRRFASGFGATPEQAYERLQRNMNRRMKTPRQTRRRSSPTLSKVCKKWLTHTEAKGVTAATKLKYEQDMKHHVLPHFGDKPIASITQDDLLKLFNKTLTEIGSSARAHTFSELKRLFIYAKQIKIITENPFDGIPEPKHKPDITEKQNKNIDNYVAVSRGLQSWLRSSTCPLHDAYPLFMVIRLGLRREEILGLTWDCITDLDKEGARLTVKQVLKRYEASEPGTGCYLRPSTKNKTIRSIPLPPQWRQALIEQRDKQLSGTAGTEWENLVFPNPRTGHYYSYNWLNLRWHDILDSYWHHLHPDQKTIPDDHYFRIHDNRHVMASLFAADGIPISTAQEILGHLDSATTIYYTHITEQSKTEAMRKLAKSSRPTLLDLTAE